MDARCNSILSCFSTTAGHASIIDNNSNNKNKKQNTNSNSKYNNNKNNIK